MQSKAARFLFLSKGVFFGFYWEVYRNLAQDTVKIWLMRCLGTQRLVSALNVLNKVLMWVGGIFFWMTDLIEMSLINCFFVQDNF